MDDIINSIPSSVNFLNLLLGLIAAIITIYGAIKGKRIKKAVSQFIKNLPGGCGPICIGRASEKKLIQNKILKNESVIICGSAGIGKSNLVYHSIIGIIRKMMKLYDGILYYDFAANPDAEYAMSELSKRIPNPDSKELKDLLNEKKYLIWLDGCEKTDCLADIIKLSFNPVFILCTRERKQTQLIHTITNANNSIIVLSTLSESKSLELLANKLKATFRFLDKNKDINKSIVQFVGYHPFSIYIIKHKPLYQRKPKEFYKLLEEKGLSYSQADDENSVIYKQVYNMEMLISEDLGLGLSEEKITFSQETKKALGLFGFLAEDVFLSDLLYSDINDSIPIFKTDVVHEIKKSLLSNYFVTEKKHIIKTRHSIVNQVLFEQRKQLLNKDYDCIFHFLLVMKSFLSYKDEKNDDPQKSFDNLVYKHKNHILSCVTKLVNDNDIYYNESQIQKIAASFQLLNDLGFYKEVINLISIFKHNNLKINEITSVLLTDCLINSYEGLEEYDECIKFIPELRQRILNSEDLNVLLNQYEHIIEILLNNKLYKEATHEYIAFGEFIENQKENLNKDEFLDQMLYVYLLRCKLVIVNLNENDNEGKESLIQDMKIYIGALIEKMGQFDLLVIEAKAWFANLISSIDKKIATSVYLDVIESLITRQYNPSGFMLIMRTINNFFINEKNYKQANELLKFSLIYCENRFGNEHGLTTRIRDVISRINDNLSEENDNSELLFAIKQKDGLEMDVVSMIED